MTSHQEEQSALHALHLLTAEEARILESEMKVDARLRQTFEGDEEAVSELGLLLPPDEAPPECRAELLARVRQLKSGNSIPFAAPFKLLISPWVAWAAAAGIAVAAMGLWDAKKRLTAQVDALVQSESTSKQEVADAHAKRAELEKKLANETQGKTAVAEELDQLKKVNALSRMEVAALKSSLKKYEDGVAVIVWDSEKQEGKIRIDKMPPVQANKDYQLWVLDKSKPAPVSAGVIKLDDRGYATVKFKPVEPVTPSKFALSVEKEGGVPKKSDDGPIIFVGTVNGS
jgi:anti-sigma-K factor RskA